MKNEILKTKIEFENKLSNLESALYNLWPSQFTNMMDFCESNPNIKLIVSSFTSKSKITVDEWFERWENVAPVGKRSLDKMGYDYEDYELNYKILKKFYNDQIFIRTFCQDTFVGKGQGDRLLQLYSQMILPIAKKIIIELNNMI